MISTGVLGSSRNMKAGVSPTPPPSSTALAVRNNNTVGLANLGLPFDPYDHTALPTRVIATGAATNFPSMANLVGDIFNAPVFVPLTQIDSAQVVPHRNAPVQGYPSRSALGGAYLARWVWSREWGTGGLGVFEDEMKRLLGKRWVATGGALLRTNVNGVVTTTVPSLGNGSGANSGSSTPYGHPGSRSGLGSTVFVEEEEDEEMERERNLGLLGVAGVIGGGVYGANAFGKENGRRRTQTGSTIDTLSSSGTGSMIGSSSSAYTTPDLGLGSLGLMTGSALTAANANNNNSNSNNSNGNNNTGALTPTTPTPLTPVVAMPTSDAEMQIGLAKVAESDIDSFMSYAAIVPEFARLETMVVKGIV